MPKTNLTTYQAGLLQTKAYRSLKNFFDRRLTAHELSLPEWVLLGLLYEKEDSVRLSDISATLAVEASFATQLVNTLEAKRLLSRRTDKTDSRAKRVSLTADGRSLVAKLEDEMNADMVNFMSGVENRDLAIYLKVLELVALKG